MGASYILAVLKQTYRPITVLNISFRLEGLCRLEGLIQTYRPNTDLEA